jgi:hypothetical protein
MHLFRQLPALYLGPPTAELVAAGVNGSVSGVIVTVASPAQTAGSLQNLPLSDRLVVCGLGVVAAGVGTTVDAAFINGIPAFVETQANTAGVLTAVISAPVPHYIDDRIFRLRAILSASGATSASCGMCVYRGLSSMRPVAAQSSTTTAATSRTVTFPIYTRGIIVAAALNDVNTANQCTWSGNVLSPSEILDTNSGTHRFSAASRIFGSGENQAGTVIATFDASSSAGLSLSAASFR